MFTCDRGYTINGRDKATCLENGTWDTVKPECGKKADPESRENLLFAYAKIKAQISFTITLSGNNLVGRVYT